MMTAPTSRRSPHTMQLQNRLRDRCFIALCLALGFILLSNSILFAQSSNRPTPDENAVAAIELIKTRCIQCHNENKPSGGLILTSRETLLQGGDSGAVVTLPAATAEKSNDPPQENSAEVPELLMRVRTDDSDLRMPPEGKPLSADEIAIIERWIAGATPWVGERLGVKSEQHWALKKVVRPPIPADSLGVSRHPIDLFLGQKLAQSQLTFSPRADDRTLLRRVYFDLTGLPPTWEEVRQYELSTAPDKWERTIQRLLQSHSHGERYAQHWLDVVRFGETSGFEVNTPRPNAWPYRDYVVDAFASDKPFDQFVFEQLAGDTCGADQAMGFVTSGPNDLVKSPDPVLTATQRADELHDMVSVTGSAFLGLTVGCARCHSHKFDPISQTEYYAMKAMFEGVTHGDRAISTSDEPQRRSRVAQLQEQLRSIKNRLLMSEPLSSKRAFDLIDSRDARFESLLSDATLVEYEAGINRGELDHPGSANSAPTLGLGYRFWKAEPRQWAGRWLPKKTGKHRMAVSWGSGWSTHASTVHYWLDLDGDLTTQEDRRELGTGNHQLFADRTGSIPSRKLWSGWLDLGVHELNSASAILLQCGEEAGFITVDSLLIQEVNEDADSFSLRAPTTHALNVERFPAVEAKWVRFQIHGTNSSEPCIDEFEIFASGDQAENIALASKGSKVTSSGDYVGVDKHKLEHVNDGRYGNDRSWISNETGKGWLLFELPEMSRIDRVAWSRDRSEPAMFRDRTVTQYSLEVSLDGLNWQLVGNQVDRLSAQSRKESTFRFGFDSIDPTLLASIREESAMRQELSELNRQSLVYCGSLVSPGKTFRLHRGDPMQPREEVAPAPIAALATPFDLKDVSLESERRAALARWLVDPSNPLTARVIVNRLWQWHFGEGIVATPSDFGKGGVTPVHPELLDWLAAELVDHQWSLHHIHRLILTSHAYQQSSIVQGSGKNVDARARLLWRFPATRMQAEPLRDTILAISGQLDRRAGGVGWSPFVPNDNYVRVYVPKTEFLATDFRRMVYMTKVRMQVDPTFGVFDCPDGGQSAPKRNQSITPLQALNLLNSPFLIEQSQRMAQRIEREGAGEPKSQAIAAFRLVYQRDPEADEIEASAELISRRGLALFCRVLLNSNELLYLD